MYSTKAMVKRKFTAEEEPKQTDEQIIIRVLNEDPGFYEEIVLRYKGKLLLYLRHLIGANDEAEDLLQNVFVKVFEHLDEFDTTRKFSSWIYRIAHNEAVNYLKKKSRRRLVAWEDIVSAKDKLDTADDKDSPEEAWMRDETRIEVREALDLLPAKYKEILRLRFYLDKSYAEMSRITGKPENTVATLLNRAKKRLVHILKTKTKELAERREKKLSY